MEDLSDVEYHDASRTTPHADDPWLIRDPWEGSVASDGSGVWKHTRDNIDSSCHATQEPVVAWQRLENGRSMAGDMCGINLFVAYEREEFRAPPLVLHTGHAGEAHGFAGRVAVVNGARMFFCSQPLYQELERSSIDVQFMPEFAR